MKLRPAILVLATIGTLPGRYGSTGGPDRGTTEPICESPSGKNLTPGSSAPKAVGLEDPTPAGRPVMDAPTLADPQPESPTDVPSDWFARVTEQIAASEYDINWQDHVGAFQSPNRQQDLRITYRADGFDLKPRLADSAWAVSLTLEGIVRGNDRLLPVPGAWISTSGPDLVADHGDFAIDYHNGKEGMRQNFLVRERPKGEGPLEVRLRYEGSLHARDKGGNAIAFCASVEGKESHVPVLWYKDLHVWDANGDTLEATASLNEDRILLAVEDAVAAYPITIDPISTAANWTSEGDQADAYLGAHVASAGWDEQSNPWSSRIIIGVPGYDSGFEGEGKVLVYSGSPEGGPSNVPYWSIIGNQEGLGLGRSVAFAGDVNGDGRGDVVVGMNWYAILYTGSLGGYDYNWTGTGTEADGLYGQSVACAGDVNDDGFSDVIVGAPHMTTSGTERAFIYHGSPTGLGSSANTILLSGSPTEELFGHSVASAGDVNGDGYSDVIVGSHFHAGASGRALVYHGSASGINPSSAWVVDGDFAVGHFGYSVSTAGDVNADGYSDVIVGQPRVGPVISGRAHVFLGSSSGLATSAAWIGDAGQDADKYGQSVACAGDVNGDGYADVIIGAPFYDNGQTDEGKAFLYLGSSNGLLTQPSWTAEGDQSGARFGTCVASAGDVSCDGYSDLIIGAPFYDNNATDEGRAYVFLGGPSGLSSTSSSNKEGNQVNASFGYSVACVGDVNGDGYSDIIIGARYFDNGQVDEGRAFVSYGRASGAYLLDWSKESDQASALFGASVAGAGDVNGDGYGDVIIGAYYFDNGQVDEGRAYVYHGAASGLSASVNWTSEADQANAWYGGSVAGAGDVNGDGFSDVIIGADGFDAGQTNEGRAFVFHGSSTGLGPMATWNAESNQANASFGWSVAQAGDVNGDGYGDVIIGAPLYDNGQTDEGQAYVYHGSSSGLSLGAGWSKDGNQANGRFGTCVATAGNVNGDDYSDVIIGSPLWGTGDEGVAAVFHGSSIGLSNSNQWSYQGDQAGAQTGTWVASAGDVNGDGYNDVIIGQAYYDNGQTDEGRAIVFHGSPNGLVTSPSWTGESNQANSRAGYCVSTGGDMNGDGYSDVLVAAPYFDNGQSDEGHVLWFHGNGGLGSRSNVRLFSTNLSTPLSVNNLPASQFGMGLFVRPFLGRQSVKMVWETSRTGSGQFSSGGFAPFNLLYGSDYLAQQPSYTASGGIQLTSLVDKQFDNTLTRTNFRCRVRYHPGRAATGQRAGPWRYPRYHLEGMVSPVSINVPCTTPQYYLSHLTVLLQGPYDPATGLMFDQLRSIGLIPLTEPFTAAGLPVSGPTTISPSVLSTTGNNAIVDWVAIELRDAATGTTVVERRAALVQRDRDVVSLDGVTPLGFCEHPQDLCRVAVRHRNHLGCMTSSTVPSQGTMDFTSFQTSLFYGAAPRCPITFPWGSGYALCAGNTNGDNNIKYTGSGNDRDPILTTVGSTTPNNTITNTYNARDVNMDGQVKYTGTANDRDPILINVGSTTPNNVRVEQLP